MYITNSSGGIFILLGYAKKQPFTISDGSNNTGAIPIPGGARLTAVSLGISTDADISPMPAGIWLKSLDTGTTIDLSLKEGYVFFNSSAAAIDHGGKIAWSGSILIPEDLGTVEVKGGITNETGTDRVAEIVIMYEIEEEP